MNCGNGGKCYDCYGFIILTLFVLPEKNVDGENALLNRIGWRVKRSDPDCVILCNLSMLSYHFLPLSPFPSKRHAQTIVTNKEKNCTMSFDQSR